MTSDQQKLTVCIFN